MSANDLLIELGTEELPPKALKKLSDVFSNEIVKGLKEAGIEQGDFVSFAAPRRLAIVIDDVVNQQAEQNIERKGPHIKAAYDAEGKPTKAALGFASSCGVDFEQITTTETKKGEYLFYQTTQPGALLHDLLQGIIEHALKQLPIPKRMRWGDRTAEFVRPVHWLIVKHGDKIVPCSILDNVSGNLSMGHRFHHARSVEMAKPADYSSLMEKAFVVCSFEKRRELIEQQTIKIAEQNNATAIIDKDLLDEVTGLVEWPVAVMGEFEEKYLQVPPEVLIKTMQDNQKYFPLKDKNGKLANKFITISNIESKDEKQVKQGNERVVRPRLADAEFFWNTDRKLPLSANIEKLKTVVFQKQLGTVYDKTLRMSLIAESIAQQIEGDWQKVKQASELCKCDLMSAMVGEFASLQGVIGQYYARHDGLDDEVADSIYEHYLPRFAGDKLPTTKTGQAISIADKLDTLCGIFAIGQKPTGMKDPFALRRASLGVLRVIIEAELDLDLAELIDVAIKSLPVEAKENTETELLEYIFDRLKNYYAEQGFDARMVLAVLAVKPTKPVDFDKRIRAIKGFMQTEEAKSLAAANKRIANLLKKQSTSSVEINPSLFIEEAEKVLYQQLQQGISDNKQNVDVQNYSAILSNLSALHSAVDSFFENVMVMADDEAIKANRLALLSSLSAQFMQVADISGL